MRLDYIIAGSNKEATIYFEQLKEEPFWGGSQTNMIDKFGFGDFFFYVYDSISNKLLYSKGYGALFQEWQDTDEAKKIKRSFCESVIFPYPKNPVHVVIQRRNKSNIFTTLFELDINPEDYFIIKELPYSFKTKKVLDSGNPAQKIDIVVIPEGYTAAEMIKFSKDVERFAGYLFNVSPFKEKKDNFNIWTVEAPSEESGTDIPGENIWKKTILNSHFYTFNMERYLTSQDIRKIRDISALVPYDQIYILVNTTKYGGGGFYNYYNLCSSDNYLSDKVFTHEFGHAFAALGDEYEYPGGNAKDLYDTSVEPYQVNLSTLADFNKKWKDLIDPDTPIPTPDSLIYRNKIGAFEGAGYVTKGLYRPVYDCKMRSNNLDSFCPVCKRTLIELIEFYTK
jgi:hypothetical protein